MTAVSPRHDPELRYSPKAIHQYGYPSHPSSPARDTRLDCVEVWNLAFLSHAYETLPVPADPHFLTHVRRTCQFNWKEMHVDFQPGLRDQKYLIQSLLRRPAPYFVKWLLERPEVLKQLALYRAYGEEWVSAIKARQRICDAYDHGPTPPVPDLTQAKQALRRFTTHR